jgi:acyloxyacyl hydrolase
MAPPNGVIAALQRNLTDAPALVFYALIGNDVCNGHAGFDSMTTPAKFNASVTEALVYLNTILAPGSHVVFSPLADGELLFSIMGDLYHPVGAKYSEVYDYLNCLQTSPCWGWMNSNSTVRNMTQIRANQLTDVYNQIIATQSYPAFDMHLINVDMNALFQQWVNSGRKASDLIEPGDGYASQQEYLKQTTTHTHTQNEKGDLFIFFLKKIGASCPISAGRGKLLGVVILHF